MNEFLEALDDDVFEEHPVDLTTFVQSKDYMGLPPLSDEQYRYVELASQIYKPETLYQIYDTKTADYLVNHHVNELCLLWGKGSGKNHSTTVAIARMVYLLLCLKDPSAYYGKPPGDPIGILNVAVNAKQAKNTFFDPFRDRIQKVPWFRGKYYDGRQGEIKFNKNVTCYSGHSERESWEGYNFIAVVLDEIAAFKTDAETANSNSDRVNSASALHSMYAQSVASRFPEVGKLILISFSRFKGDFISERYNDIVVDKVVTKHSHTFKLREDLPDGNPDNEFSIEWEEDKVVGYKASGFYAHKAPSWKINPTMKIDDYKMRFWDDPVDSLTRFAGMPPDAVDAFFRDRERVEKAFSQVRIPFNEDGQFTKGFQPEEGVSYYMHVDLAERKDRAAVAMSHVSGWTRLSEGTPFETIAPIVTLDFVQWWTPKSDKNVEFDEIKKFILAVRNRGFDLKVVTFDRWAGSITLQNELVTAGVEVDTLSVQRNEYNNLSLLIMEGRMKGYKVPLLVDELLGLKVRPGGKVDHTRSGTNDLADAVCGSVFNVCKYEEFSDFDEVEIKTVDDYEDSRKRVLRQESKLDDGIIRPPRKRDPEIDNWLETLEVI